MKEFVKKNWKKIGVVMLVFYLLKGCFADPADSLTPEEMQRLEMIAYGNGQQWAQLSDDEKLALADMLLKRYEKEGHVEFDIDAEDIVNYMEDINFEETGTQTTIMAQINNYLFMEAVKEGKLKDILSSQ